MDQARVRFEQYLKRRFGQSMTAQCYSSDLDIFERTVGHKSPEEVSAADIDTFIDAQLAADLNPTTVNRRLASIRAYFEYLASERPERFWPNPVVWRRHRLKTGTRLPRDAADRDVAKLLAVITAERDLAMFSLMVGAGLRVAEVATLRLDSLEPPTEPGGLAKLRVRGKGNRERVVWLTPSLLETLHAWLFVRPVVEGDHLFVSQRGTPISVAGIQYCLRQHCRKAGVTLTCHQLRHTFARRMVENGLPVDSLARLLGHHPIIKLPVWCKN